MRCATVIALIVAGAAALAGQPVQGQSSSSIKFTPSKSGDTIEIQNVTYEVTGSGIPGLPPNQRLVLRKSTRSKQVVDEIGMEAKTTIEAWPLGADLKQKPLYTVSAAGVDARTLNGEVFTISLGLEEVEWWSVHRLSNGQRLFETYTPLLPFSISRDIQNLRYAGLGVPPDDTKDARLKVANVVAVLTYASGERVIREVLVTCDDPKQAQLLRSYADSNRKLEYDNRALRLSISQNYPSPPATVTVSVPITRDDLDLARATLPPKLRISEWKR